MGDFSGRTFGQYQLLEMIDDMGETLIFKAFQPNMNRYAAVKVLKPGPARDPQTVQKFRQEGEIAARLQHPNILPVFDMGEQDGLHYRAMALAEGGALRERLALYRDPRQALGLINQLLSPLEYLYNQALVHGNLKPSNILFDAQARPMLADFGVLQAPGQFHNAYLSPEQVQGGVVDRRSDVYALGVILYEMLVGEAPPPGMIVSPRAKRGDLPEAVERVVLKAMAQNPEARFQSPVELRNALDAALRPLMQAPPAPSPQPASQTAYHPPLQAPTKDTNWPAIILGGALIIALLVCMLVGGLSLLPRIRGGTPTPTPSVMGAFPLPPTQPPVAPTLPPVPPTQPPVAPTHPPVEPTQPPIAPTLAPPIEPTHPPVEPTYPPVEPTQPPTEPTHPPIEPLPTGPGAEPPTRPPLGEGQKPGFPICGSISFLGGAVVFGRGFLAVRTKRRT